MNPLHKTERESQQKRSPSNRAEEEEGGSRRNHRAALEAEEGDDHTGVCYLDFLLSLSGGGRVSGFALAGEVTVLAGDQRMRNEVLDALSLNENTLLSSSSSSSSSSMTHNGTPYHAQQPLTSCTYLERGHAEECFHEHITVEETLHFAQAVRTAVFDTSPSAIPAVIDCLQLQALLSVPIHSLSAHLRYIVMLATEVVTKKEVFFLHDPTIGLTLEDSEEVLKAISAVAKTFRKIVIITLDHFCQSHTSYLHRLFLMSKSGMIYFGRAEDASKAFTEHMPPLDIDLGNSYSDLLLNLLTKKALNDDESSQYWNEDDLREKRVAESSYSLRTLVMKREASYSPFTSTSTDHTTSASRTDQKTRAVGFCDRFNFALRTMYWLFWRAVIVRTRNIDHMFAQLMYVGVAPGGGLAVTFSHMNFDITGFQDRCAFLTVIAYGIAILQNSWYYYDIKDRGVFLFERTRMQHLATPQVPSSSGDFFNARSYLWLSPIVTVVADMLILRLYPPVVVCTIVYVFVSLNNSQAAVVTFFGTIVLMSVVGVLICRCLAVLNFLGKKESIQARCSLASTSLFCFLVLYAGFLLNPGDLPSSKYFIQDWSLYYWGCNNLYFSQLGDTYFASVEQSSEARIDTTFNATHYVSDIPLICNTLTPWCDYCNTSKYDHPVLPNPNYTCSFTTEVDLCALDDGALSNKTFCGESGDPTGDTTKDVAQGRVLLDILDIREIGEKKVYGVLIRQGGFYLGLYTLLCVLLNRKENHRFLSGLLGGAEK